MSKYGLMYVLKNYIFGGNIAYCDVDIESESEVVQSCPTLCDPVDCSLPGWKARTLGWVAMPSSRGFY